MLIFALIASAYMAICQENLYSTYGKHPEEAMFVTVSESAAVYLSILASRLTPILPVDVG